MDRKNSRYVLLGMYMIGVVITTRSSLPLPGVCSTSASRSTVRVITEPLTLALTVGEIVHLMCPGLPVLVVVHKLPHLVVPLLHPACSEVLP